MVRIVKLVGNDVPGGWSDVLFALSPLLPQAARNPAPKSEKATPPSARNLTRRALQPFCLVGYAPHQKLAAITT
jgi:hypothetical protein